MSTRSIWFKKCLFSIKIDDELKSALETSLGKCCWWYSLKFELSLLIKWPPRTYKILLTTHIEYPLRRWFLKFVIEANEREEGNKDDDDSHGSDEDMFELDRLGVSSTVGVDLEDEF